MHTEDFPRPQTIRLRGNPSPQQEEVSDLCLPLLEFHLPHPLPNLPSLCQKAITFLSSEPHPIDLAPTVPIRMSHLLLSQISLQLMVSVVAGYPLLREA